MFSKNSVKNYYTNKNNNIFDFNMLTNNNVFMWIFN